MWHALRQCLSHLSITILQISHWLYRNCTAFKATMRRTVAVRKLQRIHRIWTKQLKRILPCTIEVKSKKMLGAGALPTLQREKGHNQRVRRELGLPNMRRVRMMPSHRSTTKNPGSNHWLQSKTLFLKLFPLLKMTLNLKKLVFLVMVREIPQSKLMKRIRNWQILRGKIWRE